MPAPPPLDSRPFGSGQLSPTTSGPRRRRLLSWGCWGGRRAVGGPSRSPPQSSATGDRPAGASSPRAPASPGGHLLGRERGRHWGQGKGRRRARASRPSALPPAPALRPAVCPTAWAPPAPGRLLASQPASGGARQAGPRGGGERASEGAGAEAGRRWAPAGEGTGTSEGGAERVFVLGNGTAQPGGLFHARRLGPGEAPPRGPLAPAPRGAAQGGGGKVPCRLAGALRGRGALGMLPLLRPPGGRDEAAGKSESGRVGGPPSPPAARGFFAMRREQQNFAPPPPPLTFLERPELRLAGAWGASSARTQAGEPGRARRSACLLDPRGGRDLRTPRFAPQLRRRRFSLQKG